MIHSVTQSSGPLAIAQVEREILINALLFHQANNEMAPQFYKD